MPSERASEHNQLPCIECMAQVHGDDSISPVYNHRLIWKRHYTTRLQIDCIVTTDLVVADAGCYHFSQIRITNQPALVVENYDLFDHQGGLSHDRSKRLRPGGGEEV